MSARRLLTAALLALNTPNPGIPLIVHMEAFRTTAAPSGIKRQSLLHAEEHSLDVRGESSVELDFPITCSRREVFRRSSVREQDIQPPHLLFYR